MSTVEHLMAAFAGLGIDKPVVDVTRAGSADHGRQRRPVRVPAAVGRHRGAGRAQALHPHQEAGARSRTATSGRSFEPYDGFKVRLRDRFRPPAVLRQSNQPRRRRFLDHLVRQGSRAVPAPSASCSDVEMLRAARPGAAAAACDNAIVVDDYRVLNEDGLRYDDEFVKHKVLDAIGDLYLLGHPLIGAFSAPQVRPRAEQPHSAHLAGRPARPGNWSRIEETDKAAISFMRAVPAA
ncbi:MAG: UDP-3-O-acyl-N-acetylglucosamine deacetylase [Chromatiales bacterium]|nr:UDP-3-O-acyl-N-acetylglucosamine deacetylase [Chromatiales bacterium]